jgi:hypothetical protein
LALDPQPAAERLDPVCKPTQAKAYLHAGPASTVVPDRDGDRAIAPDDLD